MNKIYLEKIYGVCRKDGGDVIEDARIEIWYQINDSFINSCFTNDNGDIIFKTDMSIDTEFIKKDRLIFDNELLHFLQTRTFG